MNCSLVVWPDARSCNPVLFQYCARRLCPWCWTLREHYTKTKHSSAQRTCIFQWPKRIL